MTTYVRTATSEDASTIVAWNVAMARETETLELDHETVSRGVTAVLEDRSKGLYFLVERQTPAESEPSRLVGQLLITLEWSDWRNAFVWWIQSVYVLPEARNQGVFADLFRAVEQEARKAGAAGLRLYVDERNASAQKVYTKLGMSGEHYRVFEKMFGP